MPIICTKDCVCGRRNRIDARYCVICSMDFKDEVGSPPEDNGFHIEKKETLQFANHEESIIGADVTSTPLFLSTSGEGWHLRPRPSNKWSTLEFKKIPIDPSTDRGPLLGVVHRKNTEPWALFVWEKSIWGYNGFSGELIKVWPDPSSKGETCLRMPEIAIAPGKNDRSSSARVTLVSHKKNKIYIRTFLLTRRRGKNGTPALKIASSRFRPLDPDNLHHLSGPFPIDGGKRIGLLLVENGSRRGKTGALMVQELKKGSWRKSVEVSGFNIPELKLLSREDYFQVCSEQSVFFWSGGASGHGDAYDLYELGTNIENGENGCVMPRAENLQPGLSSPISSASADDKEIVVAFVDDTNRLKVVRKGGDPIKHRLNPNQLDRYTPLLGVGNTIWAVDDAGKALVRYSVEENEIHETRITPASEFTIKEKGRIVTPPFWSMNRIFYLRKKEKNGENNLQLEYIA